MNGDHIGHIFTQSMESIVVSHFLVQEHGLAKGGVGITEWTAEYVLEWILDWPATIVELLPENGTRVFGSQSLVAIDDQNPEVFEGARNERVQLGISLSTIVLFVVDPEVLDPGFDRVKQTFLSVSGDAGE